MEYDKTGAVDVFRIISSLMVISIHTSLIRNLSVEGDYILTRVIARLAVPFFLTCTGYFILHKSKEDFIGFCRKIGKLYFFATIVYMPINIFYEKVDAHSAFSCLKLLIFDGTYYHLWYFPAVLIGLLMVWILLRIKSWIIAAAISVIMYIVGIFGDNYYGLIQNKPTIVWLYETIFAFSTYTRNGLFYTPVFLMLGAITYHVHSFEKKMVYVIGFMLSLLLMVIEGLTLFKYQLARHDSMYVFMIPASYFLLNMLLSCEMVPKPGLRSVSTIVYLIHPIFIIILLWLRKNIMVFSSISKGSLSFYLVICLMSLTTGFVIYGIDSFLRRKNNAC